VRRRGERKFGEDEDGKRCVLRDHGDEKRCVLYTEDKQVFYALAGEAAAVNVYEKEGVEVAWDLYFPLSRWNEIEKRVFRIVVEHEPVDLGPGKKAWLTRRSREGA